MIVAGNALWWWLVCFFSLVTYAWGGNLPSVRKDIIDNLHIEVIPPLWSCDRETHVSLKSLTKKFLITPDTLVAWQTNDTTVSFVGNFPIYTDVYAIASECDVDKDVSVWAYVNIPGFTPFPILPARAFPVVHDCWWNYAYCLDPHTDNDGIEWPLVMMLPYAPLDASVLLVFGECVTIPQLVSANYSCNTIWIDYVPNSILDCALYLTNPDGLHIEFNESVAEVFRDNLESTSNLILPKLNWTHHEGAAPRSTVTAGVSEATHPGEPKRGSYTPLQSQHSMPITYNLGGEVRQLDIFPSSCNELASAIATSNTKREACG